ncbi:MAG TPA: enoyl-CoA hydratase/isomerase family protein [Patescibacteria group bacterium]|nr:enoyl-CoA hydratase/isomerase family protein [Patescibacteria group bacterium]
MPYSTLTLEWEDEIALLTLNRPEKRNALSTAMMEEIVSALAEIETSAARAAILTGSGTSFCAGMDLDALRELASRSFEQNLEDSRRMANFFRRIYGFPKPLVAAVNGPAIAGGCGIATLCDFTLAVPAAKFGYTEVRIGFLPALVSVFLVRQIGEKRARDLLLTGRVVDAAEGMRMGLVTEVVPREELLPRARSLAKTVAGNSGASILETKRLLLSCAENELRRQLELAIDANARIRLSDDFREGISSFLEKRPPRWTGK